MSDLSILLVINSAIRYIMAPIPIEIINLTAPPIFVENEEKSKSEYETFADSAQREALRSGFMNTFPIEILIPVVFIRIKTLAKKMNP